MPNSTVRLSAAGKAVTAEAVIPLSELSAAMGETLSPMSVGDRRDALEAYLRQHVALKAADGTAWAMRLDGMTAERDHDHDMLRARLSFTAPEGPDQGIALVYDAVLHQVASHYALVYLRADGAGDQPLARLQAPTTAVVIAEPAAAPEPVMEKEVAAGMTGEQIAALVFLVMALLIAIRGFRSEWGLRKRKKEKDDPFGE